MYPEADPLLDAGKVAGLGCLGNTRANGIQIDVNHAAGDGGEINQNLAFEAGFPEPAFNAVLFVGGTSDEFIDASHEPAEAAESITELGNTLGAKSQDADLLCDRQCCLLF